VTSLRERICKLVGKWVISTKGVTVCEIDQLLLVLVCPGGGVKVKSAWTAGMWKTYLDWIKLEKA
jgi:hypothetical protein